MSRRKSNIEPEVTEEPIEVTQEVSEPEEVDTSTPDDNYIDVVAEELTSDSDDQPDTKEDDTTSDLSDPSLMVSNIKDKETLISKLLSRESKEPGGLISEILDSTEDGDEDIKKILRYTDPNDTKIGHLFDEYNFEL